MKNCLGYICRIFASKWPIFSRHLLGGNFEHYVIARNWHQVYGAEKSARVQSDNSSVQMAIRVGVLVSRCFKRAVGAQRDCVCVGNGCNYTNVACSMPPWPNGHGVGRLMRRFRLELNHPPARSDCVASCAGISSNPEHTSNTITMSHNERSKNDFKSKHDVWPNSNVAHRAAGC